MPTKQTPFQEQIVASIRSPNWIFHFWLPSMSKAAKIPLCDPIIISEFFELEMGEASMHFPKFAFHRRGKNAPFLDLGSITSAAVGWGIFRFLHLMPVFTSENVLKSKTWTNLGSWHSSEIWTAENESPPSVIKLDSAVGKVPVNLCHKVSIGTLLQREKNRIFHLGFHHQKLTLNFGQSNFLVFFCQFFHFGSLVEVPNRSRSFEASMLHLKAIQRVFPRSSLIGQEPKFHYLISWCKMKALGKFGSICAQSQPQTFASHWFWKHHPVCPWKRFFRLFLRPSLWYEFHFSALRLYSSASFGIWPRSPRFPSKCQFDSADFAPFEKLEPLDPFWSGRKIATLTFLSDHKCYTIWLWSLKNQSYAAENLRLRVINAQKWTEVWVLSSKTRWESTDKNWHCFPPECQPIWVHFDSWSF